MSYEWPSVENEVEFIVSNLSELNSVSVIISATSFQEILGVHRPNLSPTDAKLVSSFISALMDLTSDEDTKRTTHKANKLGQEFSIDTSKFVVQYFSAKKEANHSLANQQEIIEKLKPQVEECLRNAFITDIRDASNITFASELATEFLIVLDINKYGNPKLPAVDIYLHHPMVDLAAAFALAIFFLKWTQESF